MGIQKYKLQVYKCEKCGNIVEIINGSTGTLRCCKEEMTLCKEQTADYKTEKHVPILEDNGTTIKVIVGSTPHPMEENHYIEWIEVVNGDYINRQYLKPGYKPEAVFYLHKQPGLEIRSYCNVHGLWKNS
ncbi:MAG TPA: desulfoferrodoxin [Victivallales bacterium]|nr:desulfoferrodoxin [Victivallales bacterium]